MKIVLNPYNYNLKEFGTIVVNQDGKIIGGFIDKLKFAKGNKFRFPIKGTMTLEVIDTKHLVIVKEGKIAHSIENAT